LTDGDSLAAVVPSDSDIALKGKPVPNHGWRAMVVIDDDPREVLDRYVARARAAGLTTEEPACDDSGCAVMGIRGSIATLGSSDVFEVRVRVDAPTAAYLSYRRPTGDERDVEAVAAKGAGTGERTLETPIDGYLSAPLTLPEGVEAVSPAVDAPGCGVGFAVALSSLDDPKDVARELAALSRAATDADDVTTTSHRDSGVELTVVRANQAGGVHMETYLVAGGDGTTGILRACND
jgi:hypothetical protein